MPLRCLVLLATLAVDSAAAAQLGAGFDCGGNAYSSAEVTEHRPSRRGPLTAVPDTLCADIETGHPPARIDLYAIPDRDGSASTLGGGPGSAPYERPYRRRPPAD